MATPLTTMTTQALASHLAQVFAQYPIEVAHGEGVWLYARDGRKVLDFYGGHAVAGLGYGHPRWLAALSAQARQMAFQTNALPMVIRERAAARLAKFAGLGLDTVFWINSGAEANENALKLAFKLTGRGKVVALEQGWHGRTAAAGAVTWGALEKWYGFPRTPSTCVSPRATILAPWSNSSTGIRPRSSSSPCKESAEPTMWASRCWLRSGSAAMRSVRC